jgi:P27 family predicted phage terminase small subunit
MGRPAKSEEQHELQGTKPHPKTAKTHADVAQARPKMPSHLTPAAKTAWRQIVKLLEERGTLSNADGMVLSVWAETQARWLAAKQAVQDHGILIEVTVLDSNGAPVTTRKPNPALRTVEQCEKSLRALAREFGCTPQSRNKVLQTVRQEEKPKTAWDYLQEGKDK